MVLEEFLHTVSPYQVMTIKTINVLAVIEQQWQIHVFQRSSGEDVK